MIAVREALSIGNKELTKKGIINSLLETKLLIKDILNVSEEKLISSTEVFLSDAQFEIYQSFLERRKQFEPIAYILNKREFWKDSFYVNNSTLIPRQDSEIIIETVLKLLPKKDKKLKFADLGTGSGCLIISLLKEYKHSKGVGIDVSKEAIKVAERNKNILYDKGRLRLELADFSSFETSEFDVIVCNPPYVNKNDLNKLQKDIVSYEPHQAIFADEEGFTYYKKVIQNLNKNYKCCQKVFFEIGLGQAESVIKLLKNNDFIIISIENDIAGIPRCIAAERI
jgi:release factor glutamine methyltransferase